MAAGLGPLELFTIGHGAVELETFLGYLTDAGIERLADVRRYPGSRRHPQFSQDALRASVTERGIAYVHFPDLGGRRAPRADSPNVGLRNPQFRAYADWMRGDDFHRAFSVLVDTSREARTAVMCSETPWWKCHRRLMADRATLLDGAEVVHLIAGRAMPHRLTEGVVTVSGEDLLYAAV